MTGQQATTRWMQKQKATQIKKKQGQAVARLQEDRENATVEVQWHQECPWHDFRPSQFRMAERHSACIVRGVRR